MNIRLLKLVSGEEIVAEVEQDGEDIIIDNPSTIILMPSQGGGTSVGLADWMLFASKKTVTLSKNHILYNIEPSEELQNLYAKVHSKIMTPSKELII